MPKPAREIKDHILRRLFGSVLGGTLQPLGIESPRMVRVLSPVVPWVQTKVATADGLLEAADRSIWQLEFEMGSTDIVALMGRYLAVAARFRRRRVELVIVWGRRRSPASPLRAGELSLCCREVLLANLDGGAVLRELGERVGRGDALTPGQALQLALTPLMRHGENLALVARRGADLARTLRPSLQRPVVESIVGLERRRRNASGRCLGRCRCRRSCSAICGRRARPRAG